MPHRILVGVLLAAAVGPTAAQANFAPPPFMATNPTYVEFLSPGRQSAALKFAPAEVRCYTENGKPYERVGRHRWALRVSSSTWRLVAAYDPQTMRFRSHAREATIQCAGWAEPRVLAQPPCGGSIGGSCGPAGSSGGGSVAPAAPAAGAGKPAPAAA